jgi:1-aminocyclopropane-1-carboxylate deaminase
MEDIKYDQITIDLVELPLFSEKGVRVSVLRLDKIHPVISGNKWFKLRYYLDDAKLQNKKGIITFGGAYSNHIIATAAACAMNGLSSIGIIRGKTNASRSHTLKAAEDYGMKLIFSDYEDYRTKKLPTGIHDYTKNEQFYLINEGGYGAKGVEGASEILNYCKKEAYSHICCAVGSGTMMAGLIRASQAKQSVIGISILKNHFLLEQQVRDLSGENTAEKKINIIHDYHFGGYAKKSLELLLFMNEFYKTAGIPTDFVYTGKLMFAIHDLVQKNFFSQGSEILMIHSGGLQGNKSLAERTLMF